MKPITKQCKIVLLGESGVGKSSLVLRFSKGAFLDYQESTIGASFLSKTVDLGGDNFVKFEIWDTAGQERYHSLAPMYYRGANAGLVVFDVTNRASFEKAQAWVKELQRQAPAEIVVGLAGNKSDMVTSDDSNREVTSETAARFADDNGLIYQETSAKNGQNVNDLFVAIAEKILNRPTIRVINNERLELEPIRRRRLGGKCGC